MTYTGLMRQTSDSSPLRVDLLPNDETGLSGRIGLTFAPGKQDDRWDRNLDQDLGRLEAEYGITLLVSLIEAFEFEELRIRELPGRAREHGIETLWFPVRDLSVPASVEDAGIIVGQGAGETRRHHRVVGDLAGPRSRGRRSVGTPARAAPGSAGG
jgi:hypothetical protein